MRAIGIGVVISLLVLGSVIGFTYSGVFDVAATTRDAPAVRWILETTRENSVRKGAEQVLLPELSGEDRSPRGANAFDEMCAGCHGAPGRKPFLGAGDMNPPPPDLAKTVGSRSPQEVFWVIKNGLRMTGMPAWGPTHDDDQLWDLVAFMERLPELTPDGYRVLAEDGENDGHAHDHAPAVNAEPEVTTAPASVTKAMVPEMETRHDHDATGGHEQD